MEESSLYSQNNHNSNVNTTHSSKDERFDSRDTREYKSGRKHKNSTKTVPEKQISLYAAVESKGSNTTSKGKSNYESPVNSIKKSKISRGNNKPFRTPNQLDYSTPVNNSSTNIPMVSSNSTSQKTKFESLVPKALITEAQLHSPISTSNTYKSIGSNQSHQSTYAPTKQEEDGKNSIGMNKGSFGSAQSGFTSKRTNDFKIKYKTEKCKFWELFKECKYGDNVSIYI